MADAECTTIDVEEGDDGDHPEFCSRSYRLTYLNPSVVGVDERGYVDKFETLFGQIPPREIPKRKFLNAMCRTGRIMAACKLSNTHKSSWRYWMENDPKFAEAFEAACEVAGEMLLEVAYDRGINGTMREKPIFYQGDQVGTERWKEYDNKLLWQLVQANVGHGIPDHYKAKKEIEVSGEITHLMELADGAEADQLEYDKKLAEIEEGAVDAEVRPV